MWVGFLKMAYYDFSLPPSHFVIFREIMMTIFSSQRQTSTTQSLIWVSFHLPTYLSHHQHLAIVVTIQILKAPPSNNFWSYFFADTWNSFLVGLQYSFNRYLQYAGSLVSLHWKILNRMHSQRFLRFSIIFWWVWLATWQSWFKLIIIL